MLSREYRERIKQLQEQREGSEDGDYSPRHPGKYSGRHGVASVHRIDRRGNLVIVGERR
jgi:hypothetical protein